MNHAFRSYTTGIAFNLSLSKNMCSMLLMLSESTFPLRFSLFVPTWRCLEHRGLVIPRKGRVDEPFALSEEGKLVVELLKRAGVKSHFLGEKDGEAA